MTDLEKMALERDAYRYWLPLMLMHAATGFKVTRERIEEHLRMLRNGELIERSALSPAEWDRQNFLRYPIYEAVAMEIIERLVAFEQTGEITAFSLNE